MVADLLAAKADVNAKNGKGATPLILAAQNGHAAVVRALVTAHADMNVKVGTEKRPLVLLENSGDRKSSPS